MTMTIGELIIELQRFDEDTTVVLSKDEEGNGYSSYFEVEEQNGFAIIYPGFMRDLDEIEGYEPDDEDEG